MSRKVHMPEVDYSKLVLPIESGGTSANTATQAAQNLSVITNAMVGMPNGPVGLNASGRLSTAVVQSSVAGNVVNIQGNFEPVINQPVALTITDFDSTKTYTVSVSAGTFSRLNEIITFTAPSTVQTVTMTVNGRAFTIDVTIVIPTKPVVTVVAGADASTAAQAYLNTTAYSIFGSAATHLNTDWQIASDAAFTTIVWQSLTDAANLTGATSGTLLLSSNYFARARHRTNTALVSAWSDTFNFRTAASYDFSTEEAKLTASDGSTNDYFGNSISIDSTGTRVAISSQGSDISGVSDTGAIYVFTRSGATWTQEAKLTASDRAAADGFGNALSMDSTGTRIVVGAEQHDAGGVAGTGAAYVYTRSGTTWTQEAKLLASDRATNERLGFSVDIDNTGTRAAVSAIYAAQGGVGRVGAVYIYLRTGTTWTQEAKLVATDRVTGDELGFYVTMDSTGTRVASNAWRADPGAVADSGAVYIFTRSGTTWTQEAKLFASDRAADEWLGLTLDLDSTGTRIIVASRYSVTSGMGKTGAAYIFVRSGTTWTQEAKLIASDPTVGVEFSNGVAIDADGARAIVGAAYLTVNGQTFTGAVYIFTRSGTTWTQQVKLSASDIQNARVFGSCVSINSTGPRFVVGANQSIVSGMNMAGAVYIIRR